MGLATSQVRLLALTSRKADVEMQIQINSKRKTMLTREATELAKLYYAKLQNSKIQYSTTNGYKDVTYGYLMAQDTGTFFDQIVSPSSSSSIDRKSSDNMILTDNYGRVILSNQMLDIVIDTLNSDGQNYTQTWAKNGSGRTVESLTIDAMHQLLTKMCNGASEGVGVSKTASFIAQAFNSLYNATAFSETPTDEQYQMGYEMLEYIYENGVQFGGTLYYNEKDGNYYSNYKCNEADKVEPEIGNFYILKAASNNTTLSDPDGSMYWPGSGKDSVKDFYVGLGKTIAGQMSNMFNYYGAIFSASFNGSRTINNTNNNDYALSNFNVAINSTDTASDVVFNSTTQKLERIGNSKYVTATSMDNLQTGLKSGVYQLVNVSSKETGGYVKAQGLDYFVTQNYVVEKNDNSERETITAWYNAARADLSEKETYWDTEITALSSELNTITTEIDSVKKLREDAISSTFKWGSA